MLELRWAAGGECHRAVEPVRTGAAVLPKMLELEGIAVMLDDRNAADAGDEDAVACLAAAQEYCTAARALEIL